MNRVLGYTPKLAIRDISHIFIDLTFLNSRRMIKYSVSGETQMPGLFVDDGEAFAFDLAPDDRGIAAVAWARRRGA